MNKCAPTTPQVREAYVKAMRNAFIASAGEHREEFDRWLQEIKAEAWLEGAESAYYDVEIRGFVDYPENPYRKP